MLLKHNYINDKDDAKYKIWLLENKAIDVNGGNVVGKYVYTGAKIFFNQVVTKGHIVYYPTDLNYLAN